MSQALLPDVVPSAVGRMWQAYVLHISDTTVLRGGEFTSEGGIITILRHAVEQTQMRRAKKLDAGERISSSR